MGVVDEGKEEREEAVMDRAYIPLSAYDGRLQFNQLHTIFGLTALSNFQVSNKDHYEFALTKKKALWKGYSTSLEDQL